MEQARRMRNLALETGDQGYGAVIVKDGRFVGQAPSRVVVNRDPTAHAEIEAIRDAAQLGNARPQRLRDVWHVESLPDVRGGGLLGQPHSYAFRIICLRRWRTKIAPLLRRVSAAGPVSPYADCPPHKIRASSRHG
jgi:hypothetical protein